MERELKALGLSLLATFAMSAVAVSAAQGTTVKFTAEKYPNILTDGEEGGDGRCG